MHVTRLTVKGFVLQASWWCGGWSQFAFDSRSRERLDGAHAAAGLQHRLVLRTCGSEQETRRVTTWLSPLEKRPEGGKEGKKFKYGVCRCCSGDFWNTRIRVEGSACKLSLNTPDQRLTTLKATYSTFELRLTQERQLLTHKETGLEEHSKGFLSFYWKQKTCSSEALYPFELNSMKVSEAQIYDGKRNT